MTREALGAGGALGLGVASRMVEDAEESEDGVREGELGDLAEAIGS